MSKCIQCGKVFSIKKADLKHPVVLFYKRSGFCRIARGKAWGREYDKKYIGRVK